MKATDGLHLSPTPLVPVRLTEDGPTVWCKCEFMNPSGSTKDRIAAFILSKAWRDGVVERGDVVVEVSSGSTSIAMALVCARLGLHFIAIMPECPITVQSFKQNYLFKKYLIMQTLSHSLTHSLWPNL